MPEPLISVVIPTYNKIEGSRDLRLAATVQSVLTQTHRNLELIVVDDCAATPAAHSLDSIRDDRLKIVRHEKNRDVSAARNTGIASSSGTLLAFLDHDDLWKPQKLAHQLEFMKNKRQAASVTDFSGGAANPQYSRQNSNKNSDWLILTGSFLAMASSMLAPKQLVKEVGDFDTRMPSIQDWEWLLRFHNQGHKLAVVPEPLVVYAGSHRRAPEVELRDLDLVKQMYAPVLSDRERNTLEAAIMWRKARVELEGQKRHVSGTMHLASAALQHPVHFGRYIYGVYEKAIETKASRIKSTVATALTFF